MNFLDLINKTKNGGTPVLVRPFILSPLLEREFKQHQVKLEEVCLRGEKLIKLSFQPEQVFLTEPVFNDINWIQVVIEFPAATYELLAWPEVEKYQKLAWQFFNSSISKGLIKGVKDLAQTRVLHQAETPKTTQRIYLNYNFFQDPLNGDYLHFLGLKSRLEAYLTKQIKYKLNYLDISQEYNGQIELELNLQASHAVGKQYVKQLVGRLNENFNLPSTEPGLVQDFHITDYEFFGPNLLKLYTFGAQTSPALRNIPKWVKQQITACVGREEIVSLKVY